MQEQEILNIGPLTWENVLINRIAVYVLNQKIIHLEASIPYPDSSYSDLDDYDYYIYSEMWYNNNKSKIKKIQNSLFSVNEIKKHGVILAGDISVSNNWRPNPKYGISYYHYITSRIHEFADDWLTLNDPSIPHLDPEEEFYYSLRQEEELNRLGIESWEKLIEIVQSLKNFAFKPPIYNDDRRSIMEISKIKIDGVFKWIIVLRQNIHEYYPLSTKVFDTEREALEYYYERVVYTTFNSNKNDPQEKLLSLDEYKKILVIKNINDPYLF